MSRWNDRSGSRSQHRSSSTPARTSWPWRYQSPTRDGLLLTVGYLALTAAIVVASSNPATGYELSMYAAEHTPLTFWMGIGVSLGASLVAALFSTSRRIRGVGLLLGGAAMLAVVGLPLIRGYYFYGQTDPLIHLGYTRAIASGGFDPTSLLYPGSHLAAILVGDVMGLAYRRSMMLVVVVLAGLFFVFVPLTVRLLIDDRIAVATAAFSGFLLLPLNNVSTFLRFHPFSLTLLFLPLVFYVLLRHVLTGTPRLRTVGSGSGVMLLVGGLAVLVYHPQVMLNLLVLVGAIAGYQLYRRWWGPKHVGDDLGSVSIHFVTLTVVFFIWISGHWQLYTTIDQTGTAILNAGTGTSTEQVVNQRAGAASTIGASLPEMFVKLFFVSASYFLLATMYVVGRFVDRPHSGDQVGAADVYAYFFYGGVALLPLVAVNYLGKVSTYFFRHVGFGMVVATIFGAIAIRHYGASLVEAVGIGTLRSLVAGLIVVGLVLSMAVLYPSPFIYLPNHHVSEAQMTGYETAFENQPPEAQVWFGGVRTTTNRYESALIDTPYSVWSGPVPGSAIADDPRTYYETHEEPSVRRDHYVVVTTYDIRREVDAYHQLRYTTEELAAIDDNPGLHRIYTNGEFTLYYVDIEGAPRG